MSCYIRDVVKKVKLTHILATLALVFLVSLTVQTVSFFQSISGTRKDPSFSFFKHSMFWGGGKSSENGGGKLDNGFELNEIFGAIDDDPESNVNYVDGEIVQGLRDIWEADPLADATEPREKEVVAPQEPGPSISGERHSNVDHFCLNRARTSEELSRIDRDSMTSFVRTGGRFPILLLSSNRPDFLRLTLISLLRVRCIEKSDILVVIDGGGEDITSVVTQFGVASKRFPKANMNPNRPDQSIASHYKRSIEHVFLEAFPGAPGVIIVEDDFIFAPDFYEYFHAVSFVLELDPTLWLASAWNDNGFDFLVADPYALRRTSFFPGLGWLFPRNAWKELEARWPREHWDHWMRNPSQTQKRHVITPEIPRVYHMGISGTFMDYTTHNMYFGPIALQASTQFTWDTPVGAHSLSSVIITNYDSRIRAVLKDPTTVHLGSVQEISSFSNGVGVVWVDLPAGNDGEKAMKPIAKYFGIWHQGKRSSYDGIVEFWWLGTSKLILINVGPAPHLRAINFLTLGNLESSSMASLKPIGTKVFTTSDFQTAVKPKLLPKPKHFGATVITPLANIIDEESQVALPDHIPPISKEQALSIIRDFPNPTDPSLKARVEFRSAAIPGPYYFARESVPLDASHVHDAFLIDFSESMDLSDSSASLSTSSEVVIVAAKLAGLDCDFVCSAHSEEVAFVCDSSFFPKINDCAVLRDLFPCATCSMSIGSDQPAYIADQSAEPQRCHINSDPTFFSCSGKYPNAYRVCPCKKV